MNSGNSSTGEAGANLSRQWQGVILVMGVSGCGKSSIASDLAAALRWPFLEADSLHPASNIQKMSAGTPLTDQDRQPWLEQVRDECHRLAFDANGCVVACSALKQRYRQTLSGAHENIYTVFLQGSFDVIHSRMSARTGHFMPDSLLKSQFDALEDPQEEQGVVTVSIDQNRESIVAEALQELESLIQQPG
ncbi:MAG: gluconokinase [Gammaproteobacteria bacterium]|nr:gluconokinase [Gammaproteobacteria bacterium]